MIPGELDFIQKLRKRLIHESMNLKEAAAAGAPLMGLKDGRDTAHVLVQYARLIGGYQAYTNVLEIIEEMMQTKEGNEDGTS